MRRFGSVMLLGLALGLGASARAFAQDREPALIPLQAHEPLRPEAAAADPEFVPLLQQFTHHYRSLLRAHMHLVRSVCDLTDDQRRKLHQAGEAALKEAATRSAEQQVKVMRGRSLTRIIDGPRFLDEAVQAAVKTHLSADQAGRYRKELEECLANQKWVVVCNLVAMLDDELCLSAEQRDQIRQSITAHWSERWLQTFEVLQYGHQFLRRVPDLCIVPFLTETQQVLWQGSQQVGRHNTSGPFIDGVVLDNDPLADSEPSAKQAPGASVAETQPRATP